MSNAYESAADKARRALRDAGYSRRQVTARQDHSTLRVTIRDEAVSLAAVRAVVGDLEHVRRDEGTGEILAGGNTFLDVEYTADVISPFLQAARELFAAVTPGHLVRIGYHAAYLSKGAAPWDDGVATTTRLENGRHVRSHGVDHGLRMIVVDNLSRGAYRASRELAPSAANSDHTAAAFCL
jgi:hypothetical protein